MTQWYYRVGRTIIYFVSVAGLMVAIGLTGAGLFTPAWQTAELTEPTIQIHLSGLWETCVTSEKVVKMSTWVCTYKDFRRLQQEELANADKLGYPVVGINQGEEWRLGVLVLMVLAVFVGMVSLCFAFCSNCWRITAIVWCILTSVAAICSIAGIILFIKSANEPQNKFVIGNNETSQQKIGYSFLLAVGGCVAYLISSLLSIVSTIAIYLSYKDADLELEDLDKIEHHYASTGAVAHWPVMKNI